MPQSLVVGTDGPDASALADLGRRVYGDHPDVGQESWYRWLYDENPRGQAIQASMVDGGRVLAHYAVVPLELQMGAQRVRAGLGVNALVDPAAQGRGVFAKLVTEVNRAAARVGMSMTYVVAGPQSVPWFGSILRYQHRGALELFVRPERLRQLGAVLPPRLWWARPALAIMDPVVRLALLPFRASGKRSVIEVRPVESWSRDFDRLWSESAPRYHHTVARTASFLNWRFSEAPTRAYEAIAAYADGALVGYVVFRVRTTHHVQGVVFGGISDLFAAQDETGLEAATILVGRAARTLRERGVGATVAQLATPTHLARALWRNGLFPVAARRSGVRPIFFKGDDADTPGTLFQTGADYDMG